MKITQFAPDVKNKVALVDFSAPWCGPCRPMAPVVGRVTEKLQGIPLRKEEIWADV